MLKNILNVKGIKVLNKREQKLIAGGGQDCNITVDGQLMGVLITMASGAAASAEANELCVDIVINSSASSCGYDCNYDGLG